MTLDIIEGISGCSGGVCRDGNPWFVPADVCRVLEIGNPSDAARRLDDDEKGVDTVDTLGGPQNVTIVNESGRS